MDLKVSHRKPHRGSYQRVRMPGKEASPCRTSKRRAEDRVRGWANVRIKLKASADVRCNEHSLPSKKHVARRGAANVHFPRSGQGITATHSANFSAGIQYRKVGSVALVMDRVPSPSSINPVSDGSRGVFGDGFRARACLKVQHSRERL